MSTGEKRIFELTETQTFGNGDYLPLDNISNSETKKIEAKKLGITYTMTDTEDGFSFDGSNGYHYEKVIPKDAEMSYDDYEDLTEAEKMDGSNRFIPDYPEEEKQPEIWTRVGRTPLETDAKTISPAINELKERIDDSDTEIEEIKSNLTNLETEVSDKDSLVLIRELATWNIGANMSLEEYWDIYTEYYIYISHTATSDTYYQIILNKGFASHEFIVGYGTNSNSYAIMKYTSSNYYLNLVDARVGGSTYNPKIVVFGKK